ncbi:MAG: DUF4249 family protein [Cytophagaceae bacterium]
MKRIGLFLGITFCLLCCNSRKNIDVVLPAYDKKLVVECYLEPGHPYQLLLTESVSYFSAPEVPRVDEAIITITHKGKTDTLKFVQIVADTVRNMFYNYMADSSIIVPHNDFEPFFLYVFDKRTNRTLTSSTVLPKFVKIDTLELKFNNEPKAASIIKFQEDQTRQNFYRYIITIDHPAGNKRVDFILTDELYKTETAAMGTNYWFESGTPLYVSFYHLTREHYDFITSVKNAQEANSSPFAQPASIKSNVAGGLGIFTGVAVDKKVITVP